MAQHVTALKMGLLHHVIESEAKQSPGGEAKHVSIAVSPHPEIAPTGRDWRSSQSVISPQGDTTMDENGPTRSFSTYIKPRSTKRRDGVGHPFVPPFTIPSPLTGEG